MPDWLQWRVDGPRRPSPPIIRETEIAVRTHGVVSWFDRDTGAPTRTMNDESLLLLVDLADGYLSHQKIGRDVDVVNAYDDDGALRWRWDVPESQLGCVLRGTDGVYAAVPQDIGGADLWRLDESTGNAERLTSHIRAGGELVMVGRHLWWWSRWTEFGPGIARLNLDTGIRDVFSDEDHLGLAVDGDTLVTTSRAGPITVRDVEDGALLWSADAIPQDCVAASDGSLFYVDAEGKIRHCDLRTGETKWRSDARVAESVAGLHVAGPWVFARHDSMATLHDSRSGRALGAVDYRRKATAVTALGDDILITHVRGLLRMNGDPATWPSDLTNAAKLFTDPDAAATPG